MGRLPPLARAMREYVQQDLEASDTPTFDDVLESSRVTATRVATS